MKSKMKNTQTSLFDVVVLAASAGGHIAVTTILHNLPANFPVPILVMLHLGTESTGTPEVLGRQLPFTVSWLQPDATLAPGKVLVCPPKSFVDLLPDGTFVISPSEGGALVDKPMDRLLTSIARSFGERAIGVILTGMGSDGALGARQLHLAGGTVVVQSESSAEYPDMPRAAIKAGAADLVVPLQDIGQVIGELVAGTPRPQARSEIEAVRHVFGEKGKMAARAREIDWSDHPLGPVHGWPVRLRELVRLVIDKPIPAQLLWGERQFMFFNEAAIPTLGDPWTGMYGNSYLEAFPDRREDIQLHMGVLSGEPIQVREKYFTYQRNGRLQDSWFDGVYTPIHASDGTVVGIYISWFERTWEVLAARRLKTLNQMAASQIAANRREALELALTCGAC